MDAHSTDGTGRTGTDGTDTDGRTDGRTDVAGEGGRAGDIGIVGQQRAVHSGRPVSYTAEASPAATRQ